MEEPNLVWRCIHLCDPEARVPYRGCSGAQKDWLAVMESLPSLVLPSSQAQVPVHREVTLALSSQALSSVTNHSPGPTHSLWPGLLPCANSPGLLFSCLVTQLVPHSEMQGQIGVDKK